MPKQRHAGTKRMERETYRAVGLPDAIRSRAQRVRAERGGAFVVLGGGRTGLPSLRVPRHRYQEVRFAVMREMLAKAKATGIELAPERLLETLSARIDTLIYERIANMEQAEAATDGAFLRHHGRNATKAEREALKRAHRRTEGQGKGAPASVANQANNAGLIDHVVGRIAGRQTHNPAHYQTAWAEAVGPEIAQQSELSRVDEAAGVAYFRCYNSALSYQLQRRADLPRRLAKSLRARISRLQPSY